MHPGSRLLVSKKLMSTFKTHLKKYWSFYFSGLILSGLVAAYFSIPVFQTFSKTTWEILWSNDEALITSYFKQFGIWGPLLIILVMVVQMFLLVFPTWLPMVVAVLGYGPFWGVVISVAAAFTASTVGYFLGEQLARPVKQYLVSEEKFEKLSRFMQEHGFIAVILFRISPFLSNDAISFIAGSIKMGYRKYILATLAGTIPLASAIAYFGRDLESLKSGLYWIGGFGVVFYGVYLFMKYRKKSNGTRPGPK